MEQAKKQRKKLVVGVTLPPELQERVAALAEAREWSIAQTGGYLIKLGLEHLDELIPSQSQVIPQQPDACRAT